MAHTAKERPTKLKLPSFRRWLLGVHTDLLSIHEYVPSRASPENLSNLEKMLLVLEDRRFFHHSGTDYISVLREVGKWITLQRHGGASTLDMQFVRTITRRKQRTASRKLREVMLAKLIQYRYSKIRIMRGYLNCAFFGSKLIGSDAAAQKMFSKSPEQLNLDEAAFVAAMLVYPRPLQPSPQWRAKVERRANYGKAVYIRNKKKIDQIRVPEPYYV